MVFPDKKIVMFLLLVFFIVTGLHAASEPPQKNIPTPIMPTKEIISKSNMPKKTIEELNLPYKPKDPPLFVDGVPVTEDGTMIVDGDISPDDQATADAIAVDWSKMPYVPSKYPEFKPAPDPEME
ncbi:MAG: hypothetical protein HQM16_10430 [Deltaproteobacteria bacterium]|nr:hypothetical protein [Deltaproteobacteria bacterium]